MADKPVNTQQLQQLIERLGAIPAHTAIIEMYLTMMESLHRARLKDQEIQPKGTSQGDLSDRTTIWADLRNARIFEFTLEAFGTAYHAADVYTEHLAGNEWEPFTGKQESDESVDRLWSVYDSAAKTVPFPEHLPFETCYFAYGQGVPLTGAQMFAQGFGTKAEMGPGRLLGHLISARGDVITITLGTGEIMGFGFAHHCLGNRWVEPQALTPWVVTLLVAAINEHKHLVIEDASFGYKHKFRKAAKGQGIKHPIPPPYYVVHLKDELVRDQKLIRRTFPSRPIEWAHRWDVRKHERAKVQRGPLPIDPKHEKLLTKRGYKIFTLGQLDADTYALLMHRGVLAKRSDEWMAVKRTWVEPYIKGPQGKPYIPAIRKPTRSFA